MRDQIESIYQAIQYIESNLENHISVADVADEVSYSLFHFCRVFNKITQHTPYNYLMRRRLSESAEALVESDRKIIDIAFQYQFNSHEGFSRAFKKMFAVQPNQWRKTGTIEGRQLMPRLTQAHLHHLHKGSYLEPTYREQAEFKVSGVMGLVKGKSNIIQDLWDIIVQVIRVQPEAERSDTFFGINTPTGEGIKGYFYMAAFEQHARQIRNLKLQQNDPCDDLRQIYP